MESSKKSNFKRDLKYIIIAMLLIVFGVLFALQVFNWNAERKKALEENENQNALLIEVQSVDAKLTELT